MKTFEQLKRSVRYFFLRMAMLSVLVILGAMSIAQSQRDRAPRVPLGTAEPLANRQITAMPNQAEQLVSHDVPASRGEWNTPAEPAGAESETDARLQEQMASEASSDTALREPPPFERTAHGLSEEPTPYATPGSEPESDYANPSAEAPPQASLAAYDRNAKANPLRAQAMASDEGVPGLVEQPEQPYDQAPLADDASQPMSEAEYGNHAPLTAEAEMPATAETDEQGVQELPATDEHAAEARGAAESDVPERMPEGAGFAADAGPSASDAPAYAEPETYAAPETYAEPGSEGADRGQRQPESLPPDESPDTRPSAPAYGDQATSEPPAPRAAPLQPVTRSSQEFDANATASNEISTGTPGPKEFEGPQTPSVILQKEVPEEIQVGQSARLALRIRNTGQINAQRVVVRDQIPRGCRLVRTVPEARREADGGLAWELGTLPPGQEVIVEMHVEPQDEGRIGSVATLAFEAHATASTLVTKPNLTIQHTGPQQVMVGDMVRFAIQISNPGTGTAEHVVLQEDVPPGLSHTAGRKLEYEVGSIRPGETRHLELTLKAAQAGQVENLIFARAQGDIQVQHVAQVEIIAPELRVGIEGPNRRYLNRAALYTVKLENPGTAAANNIDLTVQLPDGLKFVNTNNAGHYDASRHAIQWNLASLPAKKRGKVQFTVSPTNMGDHKIVANAQAELGLSDKQEHLVSVDGVPALLFSVADASDPVEVNGQTSYDIHVVNQGSKAATNVVLIAELPEGLQATHAEGATNGSVTPQQVVFEPVAQLLPQQELKFRVDVRGVQDGDWRFTVTMKSDETTTPVTKQESTHVYSDQ